MEIMTSDALTIRWCADPAVAAELATFFAANITPDYISHSELQSPRALDIGVWRPDIAIQVLDEITDRITREGGTITPGTESYPVMEARIDGRLVGVALVSFFLAPAVVPYAVLEDITVDRTMRDRGIGKALIAWIDAEATRAGCARIFLESGIANHHAHALFERVGFSPCSVVMMKPLGVKIGSIT
jgi:GNAT superfamily N-acetyltransferase